MKRCSVTDCPKRAVCRGMCNRHYMLWYRHGDPTVQLKRAYELHGEAQSKTYRIWMHMVGRCSNPNDKNYRYYGGRGITVCDAWKTSYTQFVADMGHQPEGLEIDRIDNDGNYEPSNCRWTTRSEQVRNRRNLGRRRRSVPDEVVKDWLGP